MSVRPSKAAVARVKRALKAIRWIDWPNAVVRISCESGVVFDTGEPPYRIGGFLFIGRDGKVLGARNDVPMTPQDERNIVVSLERLGLVHRGDSNEYGIHRSIELAAKIKGEALEELERHARDLGYKIVKL